jgi:hypothetical protein
MVAKFKKSGPRKDILSCFFFQKQTVGLFYLSVPCCLELITVERRPFSDIDVQDAIAESLLGGKLHWT